MPPKRSGRGKKKTAAEAVMEGIDVEQLKATQKGVLPVSSDIGSKGANSEELGAVENSGLPTVTPKGKLDAISEIVEVENGFPEDTNVVKEPERNVVKEKTRGRRNAKQAISEIVEVENGFSEDTNVVKEPEGNIVEEKTRGHRNAKQSSQEEDATDIEKESTTQKGKNGRSANLHSSEAEQEKKEMVLKKTKKGQNTDDMDAKDPKENEAKSRGLRNARQQSKDLVQEENAIVSEKVSMLQKAKNKKNEVKKMKVAALKKSRNKRNASDEETKNTAPKKIKGSPSNKVEGEMPLVEDVSSKSENKDIELVIPKKGQSSKGDASEAEEETTEKTLKKTRSGLRGKVDNNEDIASIKPKGRPARLQAIKESGAGESTQQKVKNAKQLSAGAQAMTKGTQGRKRKNNQAEVIEEASTSPEMEVLNENRVLKVSLLRQKSVDDMVLESLTTSEVKVKEAAGNSKSRGKRGRQEDGDEGRQAKASKASKPSKKEKIPDVSALDFTNTSTTADGEPWNFKIASWNINGIRAWLEKDGASYLVHEKPDVLCVQETKCSEDKLPEAANVAGYHCYWLAGDKDGYSGVGMLSKKKPLSVNYGIGIEEHDAEGRVITADYPKFYLVAAYVPNAGRGLVRLEYRKKWDVEFQAYLKKLDQTKPVVLCGDLNVAHNEIDLANPKSNKKNAGFTQEERDGFSSLLAQGFIDSYRKLYPDKTGTYTFWTYMMNARAKNVGWRIDYFVMSERFADRLCDCCPRKEVMGSDHCPLVLFLSI